MRWKKAMGHPGPMSELAPSFPLQPASISTAGRHSLWAGISQECFFTVTFLRGVGSGHLCCWSIWPYPVNVCPAICHFDLLSIAQLIASASPDVRCNGRTSCFQQGAVTMLATDSRWWPQVYLANPSVYRNKEVFSHMLLLYFHEEGLKQSVGECPWHHFTMSISTDFLMYHLLLCSQFLSGGLILSEGCNNLQLFSPAGGNARSYHHRQQSI